MVRLLSFLRGSSRQAPKRRTHTFRPQLEPLEDRRLMSGVVMNLGGDFTINTYTGVGFEENVVATLSASVNGKPDANKDDFKASIQWQNGKTTTGDLVYEGPADATASYYLIKGSFNYTSAGTFPIKVQVTGPDGTTTPWRQDASALVSPMPSGLPGTVPPPTAHTMQPADVLLGLGGNYLPTATAGAALWDTTIASLTATVNNKPDSSPNDLHAQVNWGDSTAWTPADLVFLGSRGNQADFNVQGSHTYAQPGNYYFVVYINGPDGTSVCAKTGSVLVGAGQGTLGLAPEATPLKARAGANIGGMPLATVPETGKLLTASISYGDGSGSEPGKVVPLAGGIGEIESGPHSFPSPGTYDVAVTVEEDGGGTQTITEPFYVDPAQPLAITPPVLPSALVGKDYPEVITATGGSGSYTFTVTAGSLPPGLGLDPSSGIITGQPTSAGQYQFTVRAKDNLLSSLAPAAQPYTVTVWQPLTISPAVLPTAVVREAYPEVITATGGSGSHSFSITSGSLPPGLRLLPSGAFTGQPTSAGQYQFTVQAKDNHLSNLAPANHPYMLTVALPTIPPTDLAKNDNGGNWAGYTVRPKSPVVSVGGSWTQPKISGVNNAIVAIWVGIGDGSSEPLVQIGTVSYVSNGATYYRAVYQVYPQTSPVLIDGFDVRPGDQISVEVAYTPSEAMEAITNYTLQIWDKPPKASGRRDDYREIAVAVTSPLRSTAEWIVEETQKPSGAYYPLAVFGPVGFTGAWAKAGTTTGSIRLFPKTMLGIRNSISHLFETTTSPLTNGNTPGKDEPPGGTTSSSFTVTYIP